MKFLVIWRLELSLLSRSVLEAVLQMPEHAGPLEREGKIVGRYHIVGGHGGAWIYEVDSNEELCCPWRRWGRPRRAGRSQPRSLTQDSRAERALQLFEAVGILLETHVVAEEEADQSAHA